MKTLLIRDLSEDTVVRLKHRAALHRRSLQKEVQLLLEDASRSQPLGVQEWKLPYPVRSVEDSPDQGWSRDEMYAEDGR